MMRFSSFFLMGWCVWLIGCGQQDKNSINLDPEALESGLPSSPILTKLENLPDSIQPKKISLRDTPTPIRVKIPRIDLESYELKDQENNPRKISPPTLHQRPYLQNQKGEAVLDPQGNPFLLGDGGISHFTTYTSDDGLVLDNITSSLMDGSGNVWFGTWGGGISMFDGMSFTNFTTAHGLSNNLVHCMVEDPDGNIWIGTDGGGVSVYDGYAFKNLTKADGLADDLVYGIIPDRKGNMWIATGGGGASKFDGTAFVNYNQGNGLPSNAILKIAEDKNGNIWFATSSVGVVRFDGTSFTHFTTADGLASDRVFCIALDSSDHIWFGTEGGGVSKYQESTEPGGKGIFTNYTIAEGLGHDEVWRIKEDREGMIWFATGGGGISRFDGNKFTNYTSAQGLPENVVYSITEDGSGNLWFGTAGGGVSLYQGTAFCNFTKEQGLGENGVYGIVEDNSGNLWFGTNGGGVSKYDGKAFTNYTPDQGLAHPLVISSLNDKNGHLWFGTGGGGISHYQEGSDGFRNASFTTYDTRHGLTSDVVYAIIEDREGNLWFGTGGGGLVKFDVNITSREQAGFTSYTVAQGLAGNVVYSLLEDSKGNLWIGTAGGGVSKFDGKAFTNYNTDHGLTNNIVWSILEDQSGNLWFATQGGGVSRFDGTAFSAFTTLEGLVDDSVYDLLEDQAGNIFIGTNRGFTVIPSQVAASPFSDIRSNLEYYNTTFGYPVKDVNTGMILDSQGKIWAGNGSDKTALVRFDYAALEKKKAKPTAKIKKIGLNEKAISWTSLLPGNYKDSLLDASNAMVYLVDEKRVMGKALTPSERQLLREEMAGISFTGINRFDHYPKNLILPYLHNHISFEFGTDELVRPNQMEYRYLLEGYNKEWSPILKRNSATFGNLWEGDYVFKVMARYTGPSEAGANEWSEAAVYSFTVLPPWYRSWWAYAFYGILILLGIRRVHVFQKTKTIRKERDRIQKRELEQAKAIEKAYKELKATQAQLIQSEKMASLGELTAGIAHEIQNPLNFVNNFSEVSAELLEEMNLELGKGNLEEVRFISKDIKENLEKINHHGKRADAIVKGMLAHSRSSSGEKVPTDINALVDEYIRLSYHGLRAKDNTFNIAYKTDLDPTLPKVNIIPQDIGRVLLNIINNAFQALNEKDLPGFLDDDKRNLEGLRPIVTVSTKNLGDKIEISIKDNGPGIPDAIKDKIFQPFFTTKPTGQGTGLGLSLSYDIVKAHGGELKLNSEEGTEFLIILPYI